MCELVRLPLFPPGDHLPLGRFHRRQAFGIIRVRLVALHKLVERRSILVPEHDSFDVQTDALFAIGTCVLEDFRHDLLLAAPSAMESALLHRSLNHTFDADASHLAAERTRLD